VFFFFRFPKKMNADGLDGFDVILPIRESSVLSHEKLHCEKIDRWLVVQTIFDLILRKPRSKPASIETVIRWRLKQTHSRLGPKRKERNRRRFPQAPGNAAACHPSRLTTKSTAQIQERTN
jgi:hypothetical protein